MRYFAQFVIPAIILIGVVYAVTRAARTATTGDGEERSDRGMFLTILAMGIAAAILIAYLFSTYAG